MITSTNSINTQPLLAVFVFPDNADTVLSQDCFHSELSACKV